MTRNALTGFIDGRRKHSRSVCTNLKSNEAKNFVNTYACLNKHRRRQSKELEIASIRQMDAILSSQVTDFKERFQRACCAIHDYRTRAVADLEPECDDQNSRQVIESFVESIVGQAVEFACPDPKTGICNTYKPLKLDMRPVTKSLTRAGTDLLIVLTAPDKQTNV